MNKTKLLVVIATCLLVTSVFAVIPAFSVQPPVDLTTYYIGTIGQPRRVDPARAYDTASGELIQNVYQPLVFFSDKPIAPDADTDFAAHPEYIADLAQFEPILATALPTISVDGKTWTFVINTSAVFHDWTAANGTVITGQHLTVYDVEYTFKRMLVQDCAGAPSWMISLPGTGYMFFDALDTNSATNKIETNEAAVGTLINNLVTVNAGTNEVTFHWVSAWPQGPLMQILAQTWGCIVNKAFCIEHGCWDGSFAAGWSNLYRRMPSSLYPPLDLYYNPAATYGSGADAHLGKSKYSSSSSVPAMCGTGPYKFTSWDKANLVWTIDYNPAYWRGWNNAGDKAGNYFHTVIVKGIAAWPTRKMLFLEGEYDVVAVPRANMYDLLISQFVPISGIRLYYNTPALSLDASAFVLDVAATSPYQSKVGGVVKNNFFNNTHVRKAFCYAVNFTSYLADAWFNEGLQPGSWWVEGLAPDYKNRTLPLYNLDKTAIQNELTAAGLWATGFETYLVYNLGNDQRRIFCEMMRDTFTSLNYGSVQFKCNVVGLDWPVFLDYEEEFFMPMFFVGWLADFADADNFARPYMHSQGDFAYFQAISNLAESPHIDSLIDAGITMPDGPARNATYQELQGLYHDLAIGLPLVQAVGRRWARDWVKGWYLNQLYPGLYAYDLYKEQGATQSVDVDVTHSITPTSPTLPTVLVYHGQMRIGNGNSSQASMNYTVSASRADNNGAVALMYTAIGLRRSAAGQDTQYPGSDYVILGPLGSGSKTFVWSEDGSSQIITAGSWQVAGEAHPVKGTAGQTVQDSNTTNNVINDGIVQAKVLVGDTTGNGIVDIFDAIQLAGAFGSSTGQSRFNADADLKVDGTIDIFDAILLAGNFNKHVP